MQKLIGWSSITIAQKYVHPTSEATRAAMRRLNEFDAQTKGSRVAKETGPYTSPYTEEKAALID